MAAGWFGGHVGCDAWPSHPSVTEYDCPAARATTSAFPGGLQSSLDQNRVLPLFTITSLAAAPTSRRQADAEVFRIFIRSRGVAPTG